MWAPFIMVGNWLATRTGFAVASSAMTMGIAYIIGDSVEQTTANVFGDANNPDHKENSSIIAVAVTIVSVGYLISQLSKAKLLK